MALCLLGIVVIRILHLSIIFQSTWSGFQEAIGLQREILESNLLFGTETGGSTSVFVSHVDSVSLVQLSWYRGSIIASARLPPQPIEKTIHGRCSWRWHGSKRGCGNTVRFVSQQQQHPSHRFSPCFFFHHPHQLLLLVVDVSLHRLSAADQHQHTQRCCASSGEEGVHTAQTQSADWLRSRRREHHHYDEHRHYHHANKYYSESKLFSSVEQKYLERFTTSSWHYHASLFAVLLIYR